MHNVYRKQPSPRWLLRFLGVGQRNGTSLTSLQAPLRVCDKGRLLMSELMIKQPLCSNYCRLQSEEGCVFYWPRHKRIRELGCMWFPRTLLAKQAFRRRNQVFRLCSQTILSGHTEHAGCPLGIPMGSNVTVEFAAHSRKRERNKHLSVWIWEVYVFMLVCWCVWSNV